ncbi:32665_t:CDS:1, partial [Gigaspora margarita]
DTDSKTELFISDDILEIYKNKNNISKISNHTIKETQIAKNITKN